MSKRVLDALKDVMLALLEGDAIHICSAEPSTYTEASATFQIGTQALTGANFSQADGDSSGRKMIVAPPADTGIDSTGTGNHLAITEGTVLKAVTTFPDQAFTSGVGALTTIQSFDIELGDVA